MSGRSHFKQGMGILNTINAMPFGLTNALAIFQHLMSDVF